MDYFELIKERYSVRSFLDRPVERELVEKIVEAGLLAPTAHNNQPQRILVIDSPEGLERLKKSTRCHFNAPLAFLVCYSKGECWSRAFDGKDSGDVDASIVATHMMLAAHALGLGATWVMYFIPEAVREEFCLPDGIEPVALLPVGYPAPDAKPAPMHFQNRDPAELVLYNSFCED